MKSELFTKLKIVYVVTLFLTISASFILIRFDLVNTSDHSLNQFVSANRIEIANADTLNLATKLNSLLNSESVQCLYGRYVDQVFINYTRGTCSSFFAVYTSTYLSEATNLTISVSYKISEKVIFIVLIIIVFELIFFALIYKIYLQKMEFDEKIRDYQINLSQQLAHDIRSPLTVLNMLITENENFSSQHKELINNAALRINEISMNLLNKKTTELPILNEKSVERFEEFSRIDIKNLVLNIYNEKKIQFKSISNLEFSLDIEPGVNFYSKIDKGELNRIISNLINNSVDAIQVNQGSIIIYLRIYDKNIHLIIEDNGKGIPEHILNRIGEKGFSFDKNKIDSGFGLGVFSAKKTMKKFGGELTIVSKVNRGTIVSLIFPKSY